ncbi:MAG: hypothetical protein COU07_01515 [Candidatus Harrisonbacteria bacterium CG10_big_fil_rev_8_21_14_0_10_40_38]|uniref:phenylalanine--tRNA ligase n=1 Tax=Candidatus Harrisonbacteria bacterium CG10_big_fil_rev_8_21_14_0_10_40_38 TaxID=1974583 RepID=A0A2H0UT16_9BACT|nr:MAG: hypothetical protein COU07_01515 [Candidatus Harrisonbacteria bacterium CG10_big_fil_rev_8_21_14_0_10_40_38]
MEKRNFDFKKDILDTDDSTGGREIIYRDGVEEKILSEIESRDDFDALRFKRLLALPDLSRKESSPIKFVIDEILAIDDFKGFDVVKTPETLTVSDSFDLFNFPEDHPSRNTSDTYFIGEDRVLRTHTTSMWLYYLTDPDVQKLLSERGWIGELCYGKVYRKDEIDSKHFPVFHQIDGLYIQKREKGEITLDDLQRVLANIVKAVFGEDITYKFLGDTFPFTDPSTQIEIKWGDKWLEVVGAGVVHKNVLERLGIDSEKYTGWAFGFGIERLAMVKMDIPDIRIFWSEDPRVTKQFVSLNSKYASVSKYPEVVRDISFIVSKKTSLNRFYEIVRHLAGDLVEEVAMTDEYENDEKFGADRKSYTFRIVYRSHERTLTNEEVNKIHSEVEKMVGEDLGAEVR